MRVLAIESATDVAAVALADEEGLITVFSSYRGRRHAETITPAIQQICALSGVDLSDIDAIAVDVGPGLFTGLRVGVATAKALAFALSIPVVPVTSLEVLASAMAGLVPGIRADEGSERSEGSDDQLLVPVLDARRGEVFWAVYREAIGIDGERGSDLLPVLEEVIAPRVDKPEVLAEELGRLGTAAITSGNGAIRYGDVLVGRRVMFASSVTHPSAAQLALIGVDTFASGGNGLDHAHIRPMYLRDADVNIKWEQRMPAPTRPIDEPPGLSRSADL